MLYDTLKKKIQALSDDAVRIRSQGTRMLISGCIDPSGSAIVVVDNIRSLGFAHELGELVNDSHRSGT